ncbi:MAG TPA: DUF4185 domain-containing protein [Ktedonosporobacter sp.]|nr:DUF4185 domain-containing protein [Ktedonosporobacter sp.]
MSHRRRFGLLPIGAGRIPGRLARLLCLVVVVFLPTSAMRVQMRDAEAPVVRVVSVTDLGALRGIPDNVIARDVAATGVLGGQILWIFGDTFIKNPPLHATPADWRSSTYAHSTLRTPFSLTEFEDSRNVPLQLIPYTQAELDYNTQKHNPGGDRLALWPSAVLATDGEDAEIIYTKIHVLGPLNFQMMGVGIAHIAIGQGHATRNFSRDADSGLTFRGSVRPFGSSGGQLVRDPDFDTIYLYSCTNALADNCFIARVRAPHGSTDAVWQPLLLNPAAYQTWNGQRWVSDLSQARPATHLQASGVGWSMAWNPYVRNARTGRLGAFIGLYNQIVAFGNGALPTRNVMLVTAASPEGPWSDPIPAFTLIPEAGQFDYAVQLHPELTSSDGTILYATYAHPAPSKCPFCEEVKAVRIQIQQT